MSHSGGVRLRGKGGHIRFVQYAEHGQSAELILETPAGGGGGAPLALRGLQ